MSAVLHAPVARPTEPVELTEYLYENYGQRVFTFCYSRLRNREEAQDAAQTTFIYVLRSLRLRRPATRGASGSRRCGTGSRIFPSASVAASSCASGRASPTRRSPMS